MVRVAEWEVQRCEKGRVTGGRGELGFGGQAEEQPEGRAGRSGRGWGGERVGGQEGERGWG